jgi:hypothetical protein
VTIFADRADRQPHCGTELFEMLANLVHSNASLFGGVLAQAQSRVDLLAKNSLESFRQGLAQFQTESHCVFYVRARRTLL